MNEKKPTTHWKDRPTAEKIALIVGWCLVASVMVFWCLPSNPEPIATSESNIAEVHHPTAWHTHASAQALTSAIQYLSRLDSAMAEGLLLLQSNQPSELAVHSQVFKSILNEGHLQFGRSVFQPLGSCSSAGVFANSRSQAQVIAARQGATETVPGSIQSHLDGYKLNRADCLQSADPSGETAASTIDQHGGLAYALINHDLQRETCRCR